MTHIIRLASVCLAAGLALLLLANAVQSSPPLPSAARPAIAYTRLVTVTVDPATVPLTPGLTSRWQFETLDQVIVGLFEIPLPSDAYEISVALPANMYHLDPGPTLIITGPQPQLYYEYKTNQRALRFGNQILITQTASNNQEYHYLATLAFTAPYQYIGTSGFAPSQTTAVTISWDAVPDLEDDGRYRFSASTWLLDTRQPATRPDLQIITATVQGLHDHFYLTASIRNNGPMTAWAPAYMNLYDRIAPSLPPTGPLVLTDGWCSLAPISSCDDGINNPLPAVLPGQTVIFTAEHDLTPINGRHDIYLLVDALGGSQGLNVESSESNNVFLTGSLLRLGVRVFLPLLRR